MFAVRIAAILAGVARAGHGPFTGDDAQLNYSADNLYGQAQYFQQPNANGLYNVYHYFLASNTFTGAPVNVNTQEVVNARDVGAFQPTNTYGAYPAQQCASPSAPSHGSMSSFYPAYNMPAGASSGFTESAGLTGSGEMPATSGYELFSDDLPAMVQNGQSTHYFPAHFEHPFNKTEFFTSSQLLTDPKPSNHCNEYIQPYYQAAAPAIPFPPQDSCSNDTAYKTRMYEHQEDNVVHAEPLEKPRRAPVKRRPGVQNTEVSVKKSKLQDSVQNKALAIPANWPAKVKSSLSRRQPTKTKLDKTKLQEPVVPERYFPEMVNASYFPQPNLIQSEILLKLMASHSKCDALEQAIHQATSQEGVLAGTAHAKPTAEFYNRLYGVIAKVEACTDEFLAEIPSVPVFNNVFLFENDIVDMKRPQTARKLSDKINQFLGIDEETERYFRKNTYSLIHTILTGLLLIRIDEEDTPEMPEAERLQIDSMKARIYEVNGVVLSSYLHNVMAIWWTATALFCVSQHECLSELHRCMQIYAQVTTEEEDSLEVRLSRAAVDICPPVCWHLLVSGFNISLPTNDFIWFYAYFVPASQMATTYLPESCNGSVTVFKESNFNVCQHWIINHYYPPKDFGDLLVRAFTLATRCAYIGYFPHLTVRDYMSLTGEQLHQIGRYITRNVKTMNMKRARFTFFIITADPRVILSFAAVNKSSTIPKEALQNGQEDTRGDYNFRTISPDYILSPCATEFLCASMEKMVEDPYYNDLLEIPEVYTAFWQACVCTLAKHLDHFTSILTADEGVFPGVKQKKSADALYALCYIYAALNNNGLHFFPVRKPAAGVSSSCELKAKEGEEGSEQLINSFLTARTEVIQWNSVTIFDPSNAIDHLRKIIDITVNMLISEHSERIVAAGTSLAKATEFATKVNTGLPLLKWPLSFSDLYNTPGYAYLQNFCFIIRNGLHLLKIFTEHASTKALMEENPAYLSHKEHINSLSDKISCEDFRALSKKYVKAKL